MLGERNVVEDAPEEGVPAVVGAPTPPAREYRCTGCGYGAILRPALPICPMCGGVDWAAPSARSALSGPPAD
jgi:rubrerythrin